MRPYPVAVGARLCYIYGMEKANSSAPATAAKTHLVVFDLDGTLAMLGAPVKDADAAALRTLSERAYIAIASGKPTYYLCGFARQLGIADAVLIGENGCTMQFGVGLPPAQNERFTSSKRALEQLDRARKDIPELFAGGIWCQPNEVMFTPFPTSEEQFAVIRAYNRAHAGDLDALDIYEHCDSLDYVPSGISKKTAVTALAEKLGLPLSRVIAVGDGVNDYPMFECAGVSVGVDLASPGRADRNFKALSEALSFILGLTGGEG